MHVLYLIAEILRSSTTADLRAGVELGTAPADCGNVSKQLPAEIVWFLHLTDELTGAGSNEAVAAGGMACERVVVAATEDALEVSMVGSCAEARVAAATTARMDLTSMVAVFVRVQAYFL